MPDFMAALGDPAKWGKTWLDAMPNPGSFGRMTEGFEHLPFRMDTARLMQLQTDYAKSVSGLWSEMLEGKPHTPPPDKRFGAPEWHGPHAYMAALYDLNARYMTSLAGSVEADEKIRAKIRFAVQQWVDAMAPSNYFAFNPEAQKKLVDTQGESLRAGIANMLADIQKGHISQTDETAFEVGRNVAVSKGSVVFQNEIFQLIQYAPTTATVYERPLLIVPPCINKFYILDLQPDNSLVQHAVSEGHTVLLVSWRNPHIGQAHLTWDNYIEDGAIRAIRVAQDLTDQKKISILGFCVGGTIISTALAVLAARGEQPAASLTLLTTLLDFSDTGVLDVFIDEQAVTMRERTIGGFGPDGQPGGIPGLMPGRDLATSFSFLRPNDLVWNYVVSNYLKGEAPPAFDLLYWNGDSTNLPGPFFAWYLRNTYLENNLKVPGKTTVCGAKVDLGSIDAPVYVYGSREDHIVPWPAAYANTQLLKGPTRFVLGASGHIAGVINPPKKNKRSYWTYAPLRGRFPPQAEVWQQSAAEVPGSWWPDWSAWLSASAGKKIKAPAEAGNAQYKVIEAAPGSYVRTKA